jgi:hypothetical protein
VTDTRTPAQQLLDLPLPGNDADAATVRGYLIALLTTLWREESAFSGKRPFGDSGWQYDIYVPMVKAGLTPGQFDEYDELCADFSEREADKLIVAAIAELGRVPA